MDVNLSKENNKNNSADVCREVKYFKYVKKNRVARMI